MLQQSDGRYAQQAEEFGVFDAFWAWNAHFGLGSNERVNHIRVDWSDGGVSTIDKALEAGHTYIISRGQDESIATTP